MQFSGADAPETPVYTGCGGSTSENTSSSVKLQTRLDLNAGKLNGPYLQSGSEHDRNSCLLKESLPEGSLWITDLGYFSLKEFAEHNANGKYWLSKVNSQCDLYDKDGERWDLVGFLEEHCAEEMDTEVYLGVNQKLPCRLLAIRVSDKVAEVRRGKLKAEAKAKGKQVSEKSLRLSSWLVLCTNVPGDMLQLKEALVLMKSRWQIELLFKLWKDVGHIDEWRSKKPWRILCEVYAKLMVVIIQHWILLCGCWYRPERSMHKASKTIRKHATHLAIAFASRSKAQLKEALKIIQRCLAVGSGISKRKAKPSTYQLLLQLDA